ncbi:MAG: uracil-xanthine permease [Clostridia bacterium]|nr:uracil-xanthine permease [Clostridia bacterium]
MDNQNEAAVYNARELGMTKTFVFGLQHMFAMFGATVLVPAITGLSVSATLLFAGAGTLLFHAITKMQIPAFLGSSFAFLAAYLTIAPNGEKELLPYACFGVALAGLIYLILAVFFKAYGAKKVMRFFPPVVTGPIIISIGLCLAGWALSCCQANWGIALVAVATIIICNIFGKGMVKIVPILIGIVVSYTVAALTGNVDFANVATAAWVGMPFQMSDTVFSLIGNADTSLLLTAAVTAIPISLATMMEHIGDVAAIGSTVGKNFIANPGLHRTLTGDGIATSVASLFGAPANTTYSENTGVLALTKVYDPFVIRIAAGLAIVMSFCPKFAAIISAMPTATMGGVSLILYGMISAIGVRNVVESKVDFTKSRNVIIAGLILVLSVGVKYGLPGESIILHLGSFTVGMSGLATAAVVGIFMNAILPGNEYEFDDGLNDSATLGRY